MDSIIRKLIISWLAFCTLVLTLGLIIKVCIPVTVLIDPIKKSLTQQHITLKNAHALEWSLWPLGISVESIEANYISDSDPVDVHGLFKQTLIHINLFNWGSPNFIKSVSAKHAQWTLGQKSQSTTFTTDNLLILHNPMTHTTVSFEWLAKQAHFNLNLNHLSKNLKLLFTQYDEHNTPTLQLNSDIALIDGTHTLLLENVVCENAAKKFTLSGKLDLATQKLELATPDNEFVFETEIRVGQSIDFINAAIDTPDFQAVGNIGYLYNEKRLNFNFKEVHLEHTMKTLLLGQPKDTLDANSLAIHPSLHTLPDFIDLSVLDAHKVFFRIETLHAAQLEAHNVVGSLNVQKQQINTQVSAQLYEGKLESAAMLSLASRKASGNFTLTNIDLEKAQIITKKTNLTGTLNGQGDYTVSFEQSPTYSIHANIQALNGTLPSKDITQQVCRYLNQDKSPVADRLFHYQTLNADMHIDQTDATLSDIQVTNKDAEISGKGHAALFRKTGQGNFELRFTRADLANCDIRPAFVNESWPIDCVLHTQNDITQANCRPDPIAIGLKLVQIAKREYSTNKDEINELLNDDAKLKSKLKRLKDLF